MLKFMKAKVKLNLVKAICTSCKTEYSFLTSADKIHIDICSNCHPFYTGKQTLVDTDNRLQKFNDKMSKNTSISSVRLSKKERLIARKKEFSDKKQAKDGKLTLKDMLASIK